MQELYFDDFEPGQIFSSKGVTLSESQILDFALLYDPQPFHLDKEAAAEGPFNGLIASGFQTLALAFRIFYQANVINACSMGSPGLDELRWVRPVRPGDTLKVRATVREKRPSKSKPDRGTLLMDYEVKNQRGEAVMTFTAIHILARRGGG
ncbi:MAG: MaoC family dehydratase [Kiloniellaceae bacterium]